MFVLMNIVSAFHAYKFTHFITSKTTKTKEVKSLSTIQKIKTIVFGIENPKPVNSIFPSKKYETIYLKSNKKIECWKINSDSSKGTVIIFHGYTGCKSQMLDKANEFLSLKYNVLLVDFIGCGGSEGTQTTVGYFESENVKTCYDYVASTEKKKIFLFGTSMGAVAVLKSINDYKINPSGIIIECPFGSMYKTTCARFKSMNLPTIPMASLLVFWGGVENNFNAFTHNPINYACQVNCPTLLMYGEKDEKVSKEEISEIYNNMPCKKKLVKFKNAGHDDYLIKYKRAWNYEVGEFIK